MRSRVTCTATSRIGRTAALLVAQLDLADLVVVGDDDGLAGDLAGAAAALGYDPRVRAGAWADAAGSDLVVVDTVVEGTGAELAARCAGAVVIVATGAPVPDVTLLLAETRLPRARVFGAAGTPADGPMTTAARAVQAADAVLRDRGRRLRCAVLLRGDEGEGVHERDVRVGAGGVQAIL
jgi:malate/lactate dehydrogenase